MNAIDVYAGLADKTISAEELAKAASTDPGMLQILLDGMEEQKAAVKYGCSKALRLLCDEAPELLYPHFDLFTEMLQHPNNIFQWQALYVLAGLAGVDEDGKIEGILDDYFARIEGPVMVTAANAIKWAAKIVKGQPDLADQVVAQVLRGEAGVYESAECHEIVCGAAINTFYRIRKWVSEPEVLYAFAQRHRNSERMPTRKAAEKFIARYEKDYSLAG